MEKKYYFIHGIDIDENHLYNSVQEAITNSDSNGDLDADDELTVFEVRRIGVVRTSVKIDFDPDVPLPSKPKKKK